MSSAVAIPESTPRVSCEYQPSLVTWVGATTTCLRAIGVDCDTADVAGYSGYAFHFCVHDEVCPSAVTMLDWGQLAHAGHAFGRATSEFRAPCCGASETERRGACLAAAERIAAELMAGRPSVLWGTYLPEFGVVVGIEKGAYVIQCFRETLGEPQPNLPFDRIESVGGIYALSFPARTSCDDAEYDRHAILLAQRAWSQPSFAAYHHGKTAYGLWIKALKAHRARTRGCGYAAACFAEARTLAARFLERMAERRQFIQEPLLACAESYREVAEALSAVAGLFPAPWEDPQPVADDEVIAEAVAQLKKSRDAESRANGHLADASVMRWPTASSD